jgi:hypothetical protein
MEIVLNFVEMARVFVLHFYLINFPIAGAIFLLQAKGVFRS